MVVYRFSPDGTEQIIAKTRWQSALFTGLALAAGGAIFFVNAGAEMALPVLPVLVVAGGALIWNQQRTAGKKIRAIVDSTSIRLDEETLVAANAMVTTTIRREEVTEVRRLRDGMVIRGRGVREVVQLKPELEGYAELAERIEEWVPAGVARRELAVPSGNWSAGLGIANLGLMVAALAIQTPAIAIPCCLAEAGLLLFCIVWVWRSQGVARRLKWWMLAALLPALSLLGRAYLLWSGR